MVTSNGMKEIKLPDLPDADMAKLDQLLSFMKENSNKFIDINMVCNKKWGEKKRIV
jgi:hypothetical protein